MTAGLGSICAAQCSNIPFGDRMFVFLSFADIWYGYVPASALQTAWRASWFLAIPLPHYLGVWLSGMNATGFRRGPFLLLGFFHLLSSPVTKDLIGLGGSWQAVHSEGIFWSHSSGLKSTASLRGVGRLPMTHIPKKTTQTKHVFLGGYMLAVL